MSSPQQKQVWLVTGTTAGLGSCLVHELLKAGKSVVATTRNPEALQAKFNGIYDAETLKRALVVGLDVTKVDEVKSVFAKGINKFGRIDVVVNNAAFSILGEVEVIPLEAAHEQFNVLFWGPVYISKEAIRVFREVNPAGEGGLVINVSSFAGYSGIPGISYYNSAKFALEGFTESLRKEMIQGWNIQAVLIQLGGFNTDWKKNMTILPPLPAYDTDDSPTKQQRAMLDSMPMVGSPEKAAKVFITLAQRRKELPVRIQLGSDAITIVQHTAKKTISDSKKFESLSHLTNVDGTDAKEYTKNLLAALG